MVATNEKKPTEGKLEAFSKGGLNYVEFLLLVRTASEANGGEKKAYKKNGKIVYKTEHWSEKYRRHRLQKNQVSLAFRPLKDFIRLPCHITLKRYAPRKLDQFDNLPMSMKYILDACCEIITDDFTPGRADSHEGFSVSYEQEVSKQYAVRIIIENREEKKLDQEQEKH